MRLGYDENGDAIEFYDLRNKELRKYAEKNAQDAHTSLEGNPIYQQIGLNTLVTVAIAVPNFAQELIMRPDLLNELHANDYAAITANSDPFVTILLSEPRVTAGFTDYTRVSLARANEQFALMLIKQEHGIGIAPGWIVSIALVHQRVAIALLNSTDIPKQTLTATDLTILAVHHEAFAAELLNYPDVVAKLTTSHLTAIAKKHPALLDDIQAIDPDVTVTTNRMAP